MHQKETWDLVVKHLAGNETKEENAQFTDWLKQKQNKDTFNKIKSAWDNTGAEDNVSKHRIREPLRDKFSLPRIRTFILKKALGNLVGFVIGIWVVSSFTHKVLERRSLSNFFGIAGRKEIVVNEVPSWMQHLIAILAGFVVLEIIGYFFKEKIYLLLWDWMKKSFGAIKLRKSL